MAAEMNLPQHVFALLWYFSKKRKIWLFSIVLLTSLFACLTSLTADALKELLDAISVVDKKHIWAEMLPSCSYLFLVYLGIGMSLRLRNVCMRFYYPGMQREMMTYLHALLQKRNYRYFQEQLTGAIANRVLELTHSAVVMIELLVQTWFVFTLMSVYLYLLWNVSRYFAYVYVLWLLLFIPMMLYCGIQARPLAFRAAKSKTDLMGILVDCLNNMYFVKLFARQPHEHERVEQASGDVRDNDVALQRYLIRLRFAGDVMLWTLLLVNLYLLVYLYQLDLVTVGGFAFVIETTVDISWYVWDYFGEQCLRLTAEYGKCQQALTLLHAPWHSGDRADAQPLQVKRGEIEFADLTYQYAGRGALFKDFNLRIAPGERVGLVGFSGSGKTTLLHLLLRFFHLSEGVITVDGQSVQDVSVASLRHQVAMIPQESKLFNRSIMENIRYGNLQASDASVIQAAKDACADDFITKLPEGYDTMVGEHGLKLSGGQRQRLAIARAFLKDAPILLLDEATSSLDTVTEQAIYQSLCKLMQGRTTVVIAHRLATLKAMDRIVVLEQGVIVQQGTHQELLQDPLGCYSRMWEQQSQGVLPG